MDSGGTIPSRTLDLFWKHKAQSDLGTGLPGWTINRQLGFVFISGATYSHRVVGRHAPLSLVVAPTPIVAVCTASVLYVSPAISIGGRIFGSKGSCGPLLLLSNNRGHILFHIQGNSSVDRCIQSACRNCSAFRVSFIVREVDLSHRSAWGKAGFQFCSLEDVSG